MKFVCDRCLTKYSIADEKVRGKILKIRCKTCSNVITVLKESGLPAAAPMRSPRVPIRAVRAGFSSGPTQPRPRRETRASRRRAAPRRRPPPPTPPVAAVGDRRHPVVPGARGAPSKGPFTRKASSTACWRSPRIPTFTSGTTRSTDGGRPARCRRLRARCRLARRRARARRPRRRARGCVRSSAAQPGARVRAPDQRRLRFRSEQAATPRTGRRPSRADGSPATAASAWVWPASRRWWRRRRRCRRPGSSIRRCRSVSWCRRTRRTTARRRTAPGWRSRRPPRRNAIANGESDALNALNLGGSWRQPSAPLGPTDARFSSASIRGCHRGAPRVARGEAARPAPRCWSASAWCCSSSR